MLRPRTAARRCVTASSLRSPRSLASWTLGARVPNNRVPHSHGFCVVVGYSIFGWKQKAPLCKFKVAYYRGSRVANFQRSSGQSPFKLSDGRVWRDEVLLHDVAVCPLSTRTVTVGNR